VLSINGISHLFYQVSKPKMTIFYEYESSCHVFFVVCVHCAVERPPVQDFGTISQESEIIQSVSGGRSRAGGGTPRPKRRSSGGGSSRSRSTSKKQRVEETSTPAPPVSSPVQLTIS